MFNEPLINARMNLIATAITLARELKERERTELDHPLTTIEMMLVKYAHEYESLRDIDVAALKEKNGVSRDQPEV